MSEKLPEEFANRADAVFASLTPSAGNQQQGLWQLTRTQVRKDGKGVDEADASSDEEHGKEH